MFMLAIREGHVLIPFIARKGLAGAWYVIFFLCREGVFMLENVTFDVKRAFLRCLEDFLR